MTHKWKKAGIASLLDGIRSHSWSYGTIILDTSSKEDRMAPLNTEKAQLLSNPTTITTVRGIETKPYHQDLARLRMDIFKDFPYLYAGNDAYEAEYDALYGQSLNSIFVVVKALGEIIGLSTALPMGDMDESLALSLNHAGYVADEGFYLGESVLDSNFRGLGLYKKLFALREEEACLQGYSFTAFLSVVRAKDHPLRPLNYEPHDTTWRKYGYNPIVTFPYPSVSLPDPNSPSGWSKHGTIQEHTLQFWVKDMGA